LAINPTYSPALFLLGFILTDQVRFGWLDQATTYEAAVDCAARDLATDPNSHLAYETLGYARLFQRRHDEALLAGEKAIALGPNCSDAYHIAGMVHGYAGDFRKSAQYEEQAQRLSPLSLNQSMVDEARAKFHLGNLVAARDIALRVLVERPHWLTAQVTLAASLWNLGSEDEARFTVRRNARQSSQLDCEPLGTGVTLPPPDGPRRADHAVAPRWNARMSPVRHLVPCGEHAAL
jgi:adenylate cyclase